MGIDKRSKITILIKAKSKAKTIYGGWGPSLYGKRMEIFFWMGGGDSTGAQFYECFLTQNVSCWALKPFIYHHL